MTWINTIQEFCLEPLTLQTLSSREEYYDNGRRREKSVNDMSETLSLRESGTKWLQFQNKYSLICLLKHKLDFLILEGYIIEDEDITGSLYDDHRRVWFPMNSLILTQLSQRLFMSTVTDNFDGRFGVPDMNTLSSQNNKQWPIRVGCHLKYSLIVTTFTGGWGRRCFCILSLVLMSVLC